MAKLSSFLKKPNWRARRERSLVWKAPALPPQPQRLKDRQRVKNPKQPHLLPILLLVSLQEPVQLVRSDLRFLIVLFFNKWIFHPSIYFSGISIQEPTSTKSKQAADIGISPSVDIPSTVNAQITFGEDLDDDSTPLSKVFLQIFIFTQFFFIHKNHIPLSAYPHCQTEKIGSNHRVRPVIYSVGSQHPSLWIGNNFSRNSNQFTGPSFSRQGSYASWIGISSRWIGIGSSWTGSGNIGSKSSWIGSIIIG